MGGNRIEWGSVVIIFHGNMGNTTFLLVYNTDNEMVWGVRVGEDIKDYTNSRGSA